MRARPDRSASDPVLDIVIGGGQARLANIDYRLHFERAYCASPSQPRKDELLAALDAAQHAVSLYRDRYDYQAMVVMQYNVAVIQHRLGADLRIGATGDYKGVIDAEKTAGVLGGDIDTVTDDLRPAGEVKLDLTASLGRTVQLLAEPEGLAARAAEDYTLGTAAWIDATLMQGIWYDMTASLLVPDMVILVDHDIQFAYSRPIPCTSTTSQANCAEILVHAAPNPDALKAKLSDVKQALKVKGEMRYASATDLRLVVDPMRLLPYVTEAQRHWYIAIDGKGDLLIGSEKVVSTYTYR